MAAIFLIPTLIVGFYGANTWVPGQQRHCSFWVMVVVIITLTYMGSSLGSLHSKDDVALPRFSWRGRSQADGRQRAGDTQ